ncbi:MAG: CapA family protein [Candidatus Eisenbacteria bacterium]
MRRIARAACIRRLDAGGALVFALAFTLASFGVASGTVGASARAEVLADFESGEADLVSYGSGQDLEPDRWEIEPDNTHDGSSYALRLYGNCWKAQPIVPYAIDAGTVLTVAVFVEEIGEMQAFGVTDGTNALLYTFAGSQLPADPEWEVAYQGAFPTGVWNVYYLPVGRDFVSRYGYEPALTALVYVNDRDDATDGITVFDDVRDVTADLPIAPEAEIVRGLQRVVPLDRGLYRVGVQFHAQVEDPDSDPDSLSYAWDFGDGGTSAIPDPFHEFVVASDHTYAVTLGVQDETGLWGRDSAQVTVEPGGEEAPVTLAFVGDVMLARRYEAPGGVIHDRGPEAIFVPTRPFYGDEAEMAICNLECPLTDEGEPHPTKPYVFRGKPENVAGLLYAGIDVVGLGNNHIVDYGQPGLDETIRVLDTAGIQWSGAGDDEYAALQPTIRTERGVSFGFLSQCNRTGREYNQQPFLDAAYDKAGFAYLREPNLGDAIAGLRPLVDQLVIQMHAGHEYVTFPKESGPGAGAGAGAGGWPAEPPLDAVGPLPAIDDGGEGVQDDQSVRGAGAEGAAAGENEDEDENVSRFRFPTRPHEIDRQLRWRAIEEGADLVIAHHPHVLQGFEVYQGVLIAHSLGNFAFDQSFAETFPSVILYAECTKDAFQAFTFRPVFIDDTIPRIATGRLGREILDRMADYSRELATTVTVDPARLLATIHLDPGGLAWQVTGVARTVPAKESEGGWWVSEPIEHRGAGTISAVVDVAAPGDAEVRVGREILWHGDFEDEGATLWNLNSGDERYDETVVSAGLRSLRQHRTPQNVGPVTTDFEGYPACLGGREYTVLGKVRTENAGEARIEARFCAGRGGQAVATIVAGPVPAGTQGWTPIEGSGAVPEEGVFFMPRCVTDRPLSGDGYSWFDEVRLIEWEPWRPAADAGQIEHPNNYRFVQARSSSVTDSIRVEWEERSISSTAAAGDDRSGADAGRSLWMAPPRPNPFADRVAIEYHLPRAAHVRIEMFDLGGRRVAVLFDGAQAAGRHRSDFIADRLASGLYFCRVEAGSEVRVEKVLLLR